MTVTTFPYVGLHGADGVRTHDPRLAKPGEGQNNSDATSPSIVSRGVIPQIGSGCVRAVGPETSQNLVSPTRGLR